MSVSRTVRTAAIVAGLFAASCSLGPTSTSFRPPPPEPWRTADEQACLSSGLAQRNPFITARTALGGPSACGAIQPFTVRAALNGRVALEPAATLRCPMIPAVDRWVRDVVTPAAQRHFGQPVVSLKVFASYSCRPINHKSGGKLSEHGRANALDVGEFQLADGSKVSVKQHWSDYGRAGSFLRDVHAGACHEFSTVLGPNADSYHHNHFHLDLARHGRDGTFRVCR